MFNPFDQFTGSASVQKIFNRGSITLSASISKTEYQDQVAKNTVLTLDYQHSRAISAGPLGSWTRDYVLIGTTHKF